MNKRTPNNRKYTLYEILWMHIPSACIYYYYYDYTGTMAFSGCTARSCIGLIGKFSWVFAKPLWSEGSSAVERTAEMHVPNMVYWFQEFYGIFDICRHISRPNERKNANKHAEKFEQFECIAYASAMKIDAINRKSNASQSKHNDKWWLERCSNIRTSPLAEHVIASHVAREAKVLTATCAVAMIANGIA